MIHRHIDCRGTRIHAVEEGEGPLVILVHGFPESWYSWRHQIPALAAAGYRVLAIDQRGFGRSSKFRVNSAYRIDKVVADIEALLDAYGERQAVVVGHDWGAPVAWTFAWLHPERCRGVVGVSVPFAGRGLIGLPGCPFGETRPRDYHIELAGPGRTFYQDYFSEQDAIIDEIEEDLRKWFLGLTYTVSGDAVAAALAAGHVPPADPVEALRYGPLCMADGSRLDDAFVWPESMPEWFTDEDLDFYVNEFERAGFSGGLAFYHNADAGWEVLDEVENLPLTPPSMFIGGEYDIATAWGAEAIERAEEKMSDYRGSHIIPSAGHWIQQESPAETNRLLLEFLGQLPSPTG
ncbi:alpha/beta hydrolase [Mycobacterium sp. CVI_P3]|uniref:Alpha/beta hydrolase n=1 Tax=Mycobacterium pinniadriaticum TaxID=2994102 RepID=A0ABT3SHM6_9MYCO|nr:alpha/beta hydrolase [Mycobacterium pinniadriaticum]MCX2932537.1 alpha/beta hydrolase [Mycobacterium pinniadriaticum]MCX2939019.1 alpha/beta hydrolase [Mycobacterium pinniadriaticum]